MKTCKFRYKNNKLKKKKQGWGKNIIALEVMKDL